MTRGTLNFGGNTVKVWLEIEDGEIRASSTRPKESIRFLDFAGKYESEVVSQMKPASQASIKSVLGVLTKHFGARKLGEIGTEEIQKFITGNLGSPKTIKNQIGIFRMCWNKARAWGYVKTNPFEFLSMPRSPLTNIHCLSVDEVRAIVRKTGGEFRAMLAILAETGMRGGELCGLAREDVDLDARIIRIRRSAFQGKLQTPKTGNAVRTIYISGQLARELRRFYDADRCLELDARPQNRQEIGSNNRIARRDCGERQQSDLYSATVRDADIPEIPAPRLNLLFPYKGNPRNNGEIVRRLKPVLGTGVGLHAFRHANISLMASLGVPLHIQKERIGHASGDITARYTHSSPEDHKKYAEIIGQALCTENGLSMAMGAD
jgi:integrase